MQRERAQALMPVGTTRPGFEQETGIMVDWLVFHPKELMLIVGVGVLGSVAGILPAVEGSRVPVAENLGPTS